MLLSAFKFLLSLTVISRVYGQLFDKTQSVFEQDPNDTRVKIIWCTTSRAEQQKCDNFAMAVERDRLHVGYVAYKLECYFAFNKAECMERMDNEKVTLTSLDAGEVFVAGRYHSLVPIAQEITENGNDYHYSVAVVKKNTMLDVHSIRDLRNRKACFAGVGTMAGWTLPIYTLMKEGGMEIVDCNNHVKTATHFFGPSCAVNALIDRYNPIGDNSDRLCSLCIGKVPGGKCTDADPYAGYDGAFRCLLEAGEIAFLRHYTVQELTSSDEFSGVSPDNFELLCKDGTRQPLSSYNRCHWGTVPSNAIVTSSASSFELRKKYQKFLTRAAELYSHPNATGSPINDNFDNPQFDQFGNRIRNKRRALRRRKRQNNFDQYDPYRNRDSDFDRNRDPEFDRNRINDPYANDPFARDPQSINPIKYGNINNNPYNDDREYSRDKDVNYYNINAGFDRFNDTRYEHFNLFESTPRYGIQGNLLVQDTTRRFKLIEESQQTYTGYLGRTLDFVLGVRDCPVNRMTLCITSEMELEKCVKMKTALHSQLLKPELLCYKAHSHINCMQAIRSGTADVAVLDASDVYTAGLNFDLMPFISEVYNLKSPEYYVVAVAKESDPDTEITYLKGKNTCHGGINTAAGWVYPMAYLISNGWIRPYGCDSVRAAAEYFTKSCIPGAISTEYNTGVPYDNMCHLCHGASFRYCRRDASEDYYGHTGAFRCLIEGGGHVAFVKHTTINENTGGKRREWWARDALIDDFELLCPDGTRAEANEYEKCNLGKVKANAIVTRGGLGYNATEINAYINLFVYAQTFYGKKNPDEFSFGMFHSQPPYTDLIFSDATTQLQVIPASHRFYAEYLGRDFMRARRIVDCHAGASVTTVHLITFSVVTLLTVFTNV